MLGQQAPSPPPQTSTLPPAVMAPSSACAASATGRASGLGGLVLKVGDFEELLLDALLEHGHGS
jgi:hypothetical protein